VAGAFFTTTKGSHRDGDDQSHDRSARIDRSGHRERVYESPSTPNGSGDLYPFAILLDGSNYANPWWADINHYVTNPSQPFTYPITLPTTLVPGSTHTIDYHISAATPRCRRVQGHWTTVEADFS